MATTSEISNVHSYDETKVSFYNIDVHLSEIDFNKMNSLDDLLEYIKKPVSTDDENRNIYLARAVVKLMYLVQGNFVGEVPTDIAYELLAHDTALTFCNICRSLDIPCEVIQGHMKDFTSYRHEYCLQHWCAFMANGRWHLVDLLGVLTSTSYRDNEGMILLESEGETVFNKLEQQMAFESIVFNDFWFCTKPQIFAYFNFPYNQDWLLLGESKGPKSLKEFELMPFTYLDYHILGLQFLSETSSILHSKNGRCSISLTADPIVMRSKCFSYTLSFLEGSGDISGLKKDDLPLLVRYAPGIDTFSFNIRFPISGHYVFEVMAKDIDEECRTCQCFDFIIICHEADPQCRKLPIDAGIVGYGYGHTARDVGLKNPSKTSPTMNVNIQTDADALPSVLTFQVEDDQIDTFDYDSKLVGADSGDWFTETHLDAEKGQLTVVAGVKSEGEYALSITARTRDSADAPNTVLNYLLTTEENEDDEKQAMLMKQKKLELILESKMEERITIKTALTKKIDVVMKELIELRKLLQIEEINGEEDHEARSSLCTDEISGEEDHEARSSLCTDEISGEEDHEAKSSLCTDEISGEEDHEAKSSLCTDEISGEEDHEARSSLCTDEISGEEDHEARSSLCTDEIRGEEDPEARSSLCTDEPFEIKDNTDVGQDESGKTIENDAKLDANTDEMTNYEITGDEVDGKLKVNTDVGQDESGKTIENDAKLDANTDEMKNFEITGDEVDGKLKVNTDVSQDEYGKTIENDAKLDANTDKMTNNEITGDEVDRKLKVQTSKEERESKHTKICKLM